MAAGKLREALHDFLATQRALVDHVEMPFVAADLRSARASDSEKPMTEVSGLLSSCATPATNSPMPESFLALNEMRLRGFESVNRPLQFVPANY